MIAYSRANTDWLADSAVGISVHWTAQTAPREGAAREFADAVARFRLEDFLAAVERSGAEYVIFTVAHGLQKLPCPHPVVESILPGRTVERDLLGELARELARRNKKLIVYYNHSCNQGDDPEWERAVGYHEPCKQRLADNLCGIVRWMGERYGELIRGYWFDSAYSLDPRGPHNSVTTEMNGFRFPWESMTAAAKAGYANRLVTYNAGIGETFLYTDHQDYWAGELVGLDSPPPARFLPNGLQWHGWACLDDRAWVYGNNRATPRGTLYSDAELLAFLSLCRKHRAPMCFNVIVFQDGLPAEASIEQLRRVTEALRGEA